MYNLRLTHTDRPLIPQLILATLAILLLAFACRNVERAVRTRRIDWQEQRAERAWCEAAATYHEVDEYARGVRARKVVK